ncbi:MAG: clostripain-related cysteine peptidase [Blastocatellia bacterium]
MPNAAKRWTVMVYLAGDNDLDEFGTVDMMEMKQVGSTDDINIVTQFDSAGPDLETRRFFLTKGTTPESLAGDVKQNLGETNTGDPKILEGFVEWAVKNYPAKHYMLVLWNHGTGWDDTNIYRTARESLRLNLTRNDLPAARAKGRAMGTIPLSHVRQAGEGRRRRAFFRTTMEQGLQRRAILTDDDAQDFLDSVEMKKLMLALKKKLKRKIDILGMDACLMSMVEVAYQVRGAVDITVGSEELEPGDGWPYHLILKELAAKPGMTPRDLSQTIVKKYLASYSPTKMVTQSAFDLSHAHELATAVDGLGKALKSAWPNPDEMAKIRNVHFVTQSYGRKKYVDLVDFCQKINKVTGDRAVSAACSAVEKAVLESGFLIAAGFKGVNVRGSKGVSIYLPLIELSPLYARLDFSKKTAWDEFLAAYHKGLA